MKATNIGAYIVGRFALVRTAGGVGIGNIAATDGEAVNRFGHRPLHLSAKLLVGWKATLASGHSLAIVTTPKHSDDDSTYATLGSADTTTITALNSGAAQTGVIGVDINLVGAKKYVRATVAATASPASASGSDAFEVFALWALGGGETIPATEATA